MSGSNSRHKQLLSRSNLLTFTGIFLIATLCCCTSTNGSSKSSDNNIDISFDSISVADSAIDKTGIIVKMASEICYPSSIGRNTARTAEFQKLFCATLLNSEMYGEAAMPQIVKESMANEIAVYENPQDSTSGIEKSTLQQCRYDIKRRISCTYHNHDIICFKKTSTRFKQKMQTISTDQYFSFNIDDMTRIEIADIFEVVTFPKIEALLRSQLLKDTGYSNEEQLIEIGYFNMDNLTVTNNFSLSDAGITFHYNPYEIACFAVGATDITLPFDDIKDMIKQDSPIQKLIS